MTTKDPAQSRLMLLLEAQKAIHQHALAKSPFATAPAVPAAPMADAKIAPVTR